MKKLADIFSQLTHTDKDFPLFLDVLDQKASNEDDFFAIMDIAKYVKDNYLYHGSKLESKILNLDKEVFAYLESKVNKKNAKRDWNGMLFYLDKVEHYFPISKDVTIFDGVEDFYLYSMLFPKKRIRLCFGIEHWFFLKKGVAYRHKEDYKNAILNFENSIKCAPLSMIPYEELIATYFETHDYDSAKTVLDKYHMFARTFYHLGVFYYYTALYYYEKHNYFVAHACIWYALGFDLSLSMRNSLLEKLNEIMKNQTLVFGAFGSVSGAKALTANNVPVWFSKNILTATLDMYKASFVSRIQELKQFKKSVRRKLMLYKLSAYVEQIETNMDSNQYMFLLNLPSIALTIDKNWQVVYENDESYGIVLELENADDTLTVGVKKSEKTLDELYQGELDQILSSGCKLKNQTQLTTIKNGDLKIADVVMGQNFNMKILFVKKGDYLVTFSLMSKNDHDNEKFLLNIASTIKFYNNIDKITTLGRFL